MFYLGTHLTNWLELVQAPLFISDRRLRVRHSLPVASGTWALDSGGFTEVSQYGSYQSSPSEYAGRVRRYQEDIGHLEWAAIQDYMCEPFVLDRTGLTIKDHQSLTVRSYLTLREIAPDVKWLPVVQGMTYDEYASCLDLYRREGVEETLFGIGSICRRQATEEAEAIIRALTKLGVKLHGFGFKINGLKGVHPFLASADSLAWSFEARRLQYASCGSETHRNCANCLSYALEWRDYLLALIGE